MIPLGELRTALASALAERTARELATLTSATHARREAAHLRRALREPIGRDDAYVAARVSSGALEELTLAFPREDEFGARIASVVAMWRAVPTRADIGRELARVESFYRARPEPPLDALAVHLLASQTREQRALIELGFRADSFELVGAVGDGLRRLEAGPHVAPQGFRWAAMRFARDIDDVLRLEQRAHLREPTSRVRLGAPGALAKVRDYYQRVSKAPHRVHLLRAGDRVAGLTAVFDHERHASIGSIAVDPDWQGRGLARVLYHRALTGMARLGLRHYVGGTTTTRVLALSSELGRKLRGSVWTRAIT